MTGTQQLIDTLVECATPVRRLRPPFVRAALWLAIACLVIALIAMGHGLRADLMLSFERPSFAVTTAAALVTGILSAITAFMVSLPDRSRWWLMLPMPALAVWVSTIGYGCLTDWVSLGPDGFHFGAELRCFAILVFTSVPLWIALAVMLRYAAMLRASAVATMGGLATAAITASALSLVHNHDATALILLWNLGTALLITGITGAFGRRIFGLLATRLLASGTHL